MREHTECVYCGRPIEQFEIELFKSGDHGEPECKSDECAELRMNGIQSDDDPENLEDESGGEE
ncbi:hypothetical protein [Alteribacter aurantiacus]|uniref:hypothetical protein n=1 Tax=Alteribacter aurantiacus TaxID=254410 RepID=UPI000415D8E3|nr:hypothetical protein [Alteribacter aurantiacus]